LGVIQLVVATILHPYLTNIPS